MPTASEVFPELVSPPPIQSWPARSPPVSRSSPEAGGKPHRTALLPDALDPLERLERRGPDREAIVLVHVGAGSFEDPRLGAARQLAGRHVQAAGHGCDVASGPEQLAADPVAPQLACELERLLSGDVGLEEASEPPRAPGALEFAVGQESLVEELRRDRPRIPVERP